MGTETGKDDGRQQTTNGWRMNDDRRTDRFFSGNIVVDYSIVDDSTGTSYIE